MSEVAHTPQLRFPEFIGEWDVTNFGNISSIKRGASPRPISSPKWFDKDSSVGWVRISDVTKSKKYLKKTEQYLSEDGINRSRKVDKGNLIMSICATIGKPIYTNFNVCIHDGFIVFDSLSEDKGFIYYLLEKIQKKWYRYGQPGTQVNLNSDIVSSEIFSIPTKPEQQKIAAFLAAVDSKIEQLSKKQALLGEYKKGLMQQIFSQAIRFKADDGSEFPDWEDNTIDKALHSYKLGGNYSNSEAVTDYPLIKMGNLDRGNIKLNKLQYINTEENIDDSDKINYGDLFFNTRNTLDLVGKVAIWRDELPCAYYNSNLMKMEFSDNFFMNYRFNSFDGIKALRRVATGTTSVAAIYTKDLLKIKFSLPTLSEQQKIANFLSSIDTKIEQAGKQLDESKQFKKALLQQMFV